MKLEFSRRILEKYSNVKFHGNPSNGNRVVACGLSDRHDEADSRFSQFCERTKLGNKRVMCCAECEYLTFTLLEIQLFW